VQVPPSPTQAEPAQHGAPEVPQAWQDEIVAPAAHTVDAVAHALSSMTQRSVVESQHPLLAHAVAGAAQHGAPVAPHAWHNAPPASTVPKQTVLAAVQAAPDLVQIFVAPSQHASLLQVVPRQHDDPTGPHAHDWLAQR
jgi:hypothetical protein